MNRRQRGISWMVCLCVGTAFLPGCFAAFSQRAASEVSRDRLLKISEKGTADHLQYVGSDFEYHYVFDSRPGKERSYKIRVTAVKLADTFPVGEDSYVLQPWVIEGKPMGSRPDDVMDHIGGTTRSPALLRARASSRSGAPQPVVEGPAEADVGEEIGDDQVEPGGIESP